MNIPYEDRRKVSLRKRELARRIASGRIELVQATGGPLENFEPRFFVKIGGMFVAPMSMPNQGYRTRGEARRDAADEKRSCVRFLRETRA